METDTLQEAQRQHESRMVETKRLIRELTGIPVMDDDNLNALDAAVEAAKARQEARKAPAAQESAPVSARGRVALAREMMHRAMMELDMAIADGAGSKQVSAAREHAYIGFVELDNG